MPNFRPFLPFVLQKMPGGNPQINPFYKAKIKKINRLWAVRIYQLWKRSGYTSMSNSRPSFHAQNRDQMSSEHTFSRICPGNTKFDAFHKIKIAAKLGKSTDHQKILTSFEGGQDTPACQIWGNSLHVFPRKCPENHRFNMIDEIQLHLTSNAGTFLFPCCWFEQAVSCEQTIEFQDF